MPVRKPVIVVEGDAVVPGLVDDTAGCTIVAVNGEIVPVAVVVAAVRERVEAAAGVEAESPETYVTKMHFVIFPTARCYFSIDKDSFPDRTYGT